MDVRRRIFRAGAVLAVALAAGHLVQSIKHGATIASLNTVTSDTQNALSTSSRLPVSASLSGVVDPLADVTGITSLASSAKAGCKATLTLTAESGAMISVELSAPCHAGEAIVLQHDGLKFAAKASDAGRVTVTLPAFETEAVVSASVAGDELARAMIVVPDAAAVRRFVLGWATDDIIDLRVTEGDRVFVSRSGTGDAQRIVALGDRTLPAPMMLAAYTYPTDPKLSVSIQVEIAVTPGNCGREVVADVISAADGQTAISKVSIAVPPCDTAGDILVLNNFAPDVKIAADN